MKNKKITQTVMMFFMMMMKNIHVTPGSFGLKQPIGNKPKGSSKGKKQAQWQTAAASQTTQRKGMDSEPTGFKTLLPGHYL